MTFATGTDSAAAKRRPTSAGWILFHPQGGHGEGRIVVVFADPVAFKKASDEVVGMRADVIRRGKAGNAFGGRIDGEGEELASVHFCFATSSF